MTDLERLIVEQAGLTADEVAAIQKALLRIGKRLETASWDDIVRVTLQGPDAFEDNS